jgi:hypothetical protein
MILRHFLLRKMHMLRKVFASLAVVAMLAAAANAAPIFYLSTAPDAASAPASGLVSANTPAGQTGSINIYANSDIQLAGVSLDLVGTGNALTFTGVTVPNPSTGGSNRWFALDGPQTISAQSITSIGGAAIPGLSGNGIGQGSAEGAKVLLATVNYTMAAGGGTENLQLKIGTNTVAGWDGSFPTVFFGTQSGTGVNGGIPGGAGAVGSISAVPEPATLSLFGLAMVGGFGAFRRRR